MSSFKKAYTDENFNRHTNYGEVDQYMTPDHHEVIVSHADFDAANALVSQRALEKGIKKGSDKYQKRYAFSEKLICGKCDDTFKRRIHTCTIYKYVAWACNAHLKDKTASSMKYVRDDDIRDEQIKRINDLQDYIAQQTTHLTEFDESLVRRWIKQITIWDNHITVELKSGVSIDVNA